MICNKYFSLVESENLEKNIKTTLENTVSYNNETIIKFSFFEELTLAFKKSELEKIYKFIVGFTNNYNFMETVIRLQLTNFIEKETKKELVNNVEESVGKNKIQIHENKNKTEIDEIFDLCLNSSIRMFLISNMFNYFLISKNQIKFDNGVIYVTDIFVNSFGIDYTYMNDLILNNRNELNLDNVNHVVLKLLQMCLDNKYNQNKLYLFLICNLLMIYCIRICLEFYRDYTLLKLNEILNNIHIQESLINKIILSNNLFANFKDKLRFKFIKVDENYEDKQLTAEIKKLGEKYQHLRKIDVDTFIDNIVFDINKKQESIISLPLNKKKIINIKNFIEPKINHSKTKTLFQISNLISDNIYEYDFLNYFIDKTTNKITTQSYNLILNYLKNPSIVLTLDYNKINTPNSVVKLFDLLSSKILNRNMITKDDISTLNYYLVLRDNIQNFDKFNNLIIMFIIFQIMIPFSIDMYNNYLFEDVFLI